jgi:hypothetical protein
MGMEAEEAVRSRFFSLPAMAVTEIAARMVDLGDVACKCDNPELKRSIIDFLNEVAVTAREVGGVGDYTYPVVLAEVKVRDGVRVRDGVVCVAPACLCEAIRQLGDEDPRFMSYVRVPVALLEGVYDLARPGDGLRLRAIVTGVCRGGGDREVIGAFVRYYIIRRASEDPRFREGIINWLSGPEGRLPYGLVKELLNYLRGLGVGVSEWSIKDVLYGIRLHQSSALLGDLGVVVKAGPAPAITNCVRYDYVQSLIRKLGVTGMDTAQRYAEVLCILTEGELRALLKLAEGECGGRLRSMLERGASAEDFRSLITECTEPKVSEVEAPIEGGKPVVRPGAKSKPEVEAGEVGFELKPRTLIDIKVNCVGPNADETDECRATKAFVDFALGRSPPNRFLQLFNAIAPARFPEPVGEDFVAVKDTISKLLRAYGVRNAVGVAELCTLKGVAGLLDKALGGDFQSLIEYFRVVVERAVGNADGEAKEALKHLHALLTNIAKHGPGVLVQCNQGAGD